MVTLHWISIFSLLMGALCALVITFDILSGHKQQMFIMNIVYPVTALYAGPLALIFYYKIGKKSAKKNMDKMKQHGQPMKSKPFWQSVIIGALHCGSGCTLADMLAETILLFVPVVIFGSQLAGTWIVDFLLAFITGIIFQYFAIKPMKNLSYGAALKAALKADALSLTFWQIGMYGWMAITFFVIFRPKLEANNVIFWFMMQIAMLVGLVAAYPINWWLIKKGIKEVM